jgi:nicotinamide phosphoribosyltransferase
MYNGRLPIEIRAVKEGSIIPNHNVLLTIKNLGGAPTVWLTSYLETMLLRIWYPITVATRIYNMKQKIKPYFQATSDTLDGMAFALLDFSSRGVTSFETSQVGGSAYLANFLGSDNVPAVDFTNYYYRSKMSGFSVPATEHSIMCSFGEDGEEASFEYLLDNMAQEGGIISVVSDTWNIYRACEYWVKLADKVKAKNVTLVVRPDSGEIDEVLPKVLEILEEGFGYTLNSKGFRVLNNVKVLWGDGINEETCVDPFRIAYQMHISSDSIITGSGGGLMQVDINRDTNKFAIKGSNIIKADGTSVPIAKSPITDQGKKSKAGKFKLVQKMGGIITRELEYDDSEDDNDNLLDLVFRNGEILRTQTIDEIRELLK